ncbi:MAG: hypothetical protein WA230_23910 [Xanthobacteraceae bacterium]
MQENDRVPTSDGDVTHIAVKNTYATTEIIVFGGDGHDIPPFAIGGRRKSDLELVKLPKINAPEVIKFTERPPGKQPCCRAMLGSSIVSSITGSATAPER